MPVLADNMIAAVNSNGVMSAQRVFDPWGVIRTANASGDPTGRYCANLGHKQDDESGLVYMRARYYEPASGRFVSEDPDRQGISFYSLCNGDPVNAIDQDGREGLDLREGTEIVLKFLEQFGLDRSILRVAKVAMLVASMVSIVEKCAWG